MITQSANEDGNSSGSCSQWIPFIIIGSFFIIAFIIFQSCLERKFASTVYLLKNEMKKCTTIDSLFLSQSNQNRLIHLTGMAETQNLLKDDQFGLVQENLIRLERKVEMFQWVETKYEKPRKPPSYKEQWSDQYYDIAKQEYQNDKSKWLVESRQWINPDVNVGIYRLSNTLKRYANAQNFLTLNDQQIQTATQNLSLSIHNNLSIKGKYLYLAQNSSTKTNGDLRVSFPYVSCGPKTIISQLKGCTFAPWMINNQKSEMSDRELAIQERMIEGDETELASEEEEQQIPRLTASSTQNWSSISEHIKFVDWLIDGMHSPDKAVDIFLQEFNKSTKILRIVFYVMESIMLIIYFHPNTGQKTKNFCAPFMGNFLEQAPVIIVLIVDLLMALVLQLISISLAWVCYYPIKGLILIIVSIGILVAIYFMIAAKN